MSPSGLLKVPSDKTAPQSSGDNRLARSDDRTTHLGSDQTTELSNSNAAVTAMLGSDDRNDFDRRLSEITNSLQILEKGQEPDRSDPSQEFQLELHSLEQALDHIDPTLNP